MAGTDISDASNTSVVATVARAAADLRTPGVHRCERKCDYPCKLKTIEEAHCLSCCLWVKNLKASLIAMNINKT
jgi:hypothetical protein